MNKMVNGKVVEMTPEEEADFLASQGSTSVPPSISPRQCRLALLGIGKLADVDTVISAMPEPARSAAVVEWEYATEVRRDSPLVVQLAPALGLSDAEVDELFRQASVL